LTIEIVHGERGVGGHPTYEHRHGES
jgi:hypothetical protein